MSPAALEGIFLVAAMVVLAVAGTLLTRRFVSVEVLRLNNEAAGFIYAVIGVVYAVLLGFSAIIVWEQHGKARTVVEQEANELGDLYRDAQSFPDGVRKEIEDRLRAYARTVVEKEWPAMIHRKSSPEAWDAFNRIWQTYQTFQPEGDYQKIWYEQSLARLNDLGDQRRPRLLSSRSAGVPGVMWVVLLGAGVITVGYSFLFGTANATAHVLMIGGLAVTIALVLLSILAMHHPFAGITRLDPEAFLQFLEFSDGAARAGP